jgi:serine phosphatase RsbU (regulator of sigma subunit)
MNFNFPKLSPAASSLRWLQWVAILIAVGLFGALSLLITVLFPWQQHHAESALVWINGIAALLAIVIAPYLLRTFEQMQQNAERDNSELRTQHAIDRAINAQYDLNAILQVAVTEATRALDADMGALVLWREGRTTQIEARVVFGITEAMQTTLGGLLNERLRALARTGAIMRQTDLDGSWQNDQLNSSLKLRNLVAVPVSYQERSLGLLMLGNRSGALAPGQGFSADDVALLEAVAGTVAVAIQNARFVRESRRRGTMLRALVAHTGAAIADQSDTAGLMRLFAESAATILGCSRVAVYSHDDTNDLLVPLAAVDHRTGQGESAIAHFAAQPLPAGFVLLSLRADGRPDTEPRVFTQTQSALVLPQGSGDFLAGPGTVFLLTARDRRCLGILVFGDLPSGEEVAEFALALAAQAGVTLENAHLFSEMSHLYQREKRIAGKLQENLLPDIPARAGGFEFAKEYRAALGEAEIGGDFLDLFPLGPDRVGFVMADVSGKGLQAAVQTAAVKYTLRAFAHQHPCAPGQVLALVNEVLCSAMSVHDGFITLFFGSLNTETGELTWASAGHEPPLLRRADGEAILKLQADDGMVLGALPGIVYEDHTLVLGSNDLMLLYTDGVTEARDPHGDFLGLDGLLRLLPAAGQPATSALTRLTARLRDFSADTQRDDIAMLLVRRNELTE